MSQTFSKVLFRNFLTQLIDSPTHKNGNILDLLTCNHMVLDKIKSYYVEFPLTDTTDHDLISLSIVIDKPIQSNFKFYLQILTMRISRILINIYQK